MKKTLPPVAPNDPTLAHGLARRFIREVADMSLPDNEKHPFGNATPRRRHDLTVKRLLKLLGNRVVQTREKGIKKHRRTVVTFITTDVEGTVELNEVEVSSEAVNQFNFHPQILFTKHAIARMLQRAKVTQVEELRVRINNATIKILESSSERVVCDSSEFRCDRSDPDRVFVTTFIDLAGY